MQGSVRGFSVSTKCESVDEFIEKFRDRCDDESIVVNVVEPRVVGTECAFAILLANKQPVLAGTCVVLDVFNDTNNAFKRRGMRLGINRLGVASQRVFVDLNAARMAASKRAKTEMGMRAVSRAPTMAMPIVTTDVELEDAVLIASAAPEAVAMMADGAPVAVPRKMTQPMRSLARPRLPSVQIPPKENPRKEAQVAAAPTETRTPGSSYILPANPLMNIPDASLEGFVECRLFDSGVSTSVEPEAPAVPATPARLARGTDDPVSSAIDDGPTNPVEMPVHVAPELRRNDLASVSDEQPEPLPPPPVIEAQPIIEPATASEPPARKRRWKPFAAVGVVAVLFAAILMTRLTAGTPTTSARLEPAVATSADDVSVRGTEQTESAPPAPVASKQPVHAVLIKTYPNAAAVTVGDQSFGTTPTYIKIPGNTPVEVTIARPGYAPVTRVVTSKRRYDQVFVQLKSSKPRKVVRAVPSVKRTASMNLSDI
jgi:hypothetical protein